MFKRDLPRSRTAREARLTGEAYYFTGTPCKHGHLAERNVKRQTVSPRGNGVVTAGYGGFGGGLCHYEMPSVLHNMRNAMRIAIEEGVRIGRLDAEKSDAPIGKD